MTEDDINNHMVALEQAANEMKKFLVDNEIFTSAISSIHKFAQDTSAVLVSLFQCITRTGGRFTSHKSAVEQLTTCCADCAQGVSGHF